MVLRICLTLFIAVCSGFLAKKCKVPAGMLLGPIIAVALTNIFTGQAYFPYSWRFFARVMVGMYMGSLVNVSELKSILKLRKEAAMILAGLLAANIIISLFLNRVSDISLITALLANAPGGIQELSLLSADMGGDTALVTALQLFRRIISVSLLPVFIEWFSKRDKKGQGPAAVDEEDTQTDETGCRIDKRLSIILMSVSCLALGALFHVLNFPSGAMIGAMLAVILLGVKKLSTKLPKSLRAIAQILSGAYIGSTMGMEQVAQLKGILFPMIIMLAYTFITNVALSLLVYRFSAIDLRSAMYSCAPGGLSEIGMLVIGTGVNVTVVTAMHLLRKIAVVGVFPFVFKWLDSLLQ